MLDVRLMNDEAIIIRHRQVAIGDHGQTGRCEEVVA